MAATSTYIGQFFSGGVPASTPHLALILSAVAGGLAVGIGIIWEAKRSGHLWTWPTAFVFLGVVVEAAATVILLEFDEGISRAQQSKVIALETRLAPRELSTDQEKSIGDLVRPSPSAFDMAMHVDIEPMRLLGQIEETLVAAGWHEQAPTDGTQTFNRGEGKVPVGERTMLGIWVLHPADDPDLAKSASVLIRALLSEGLVTQDTLLSHPAASDRGVIHVWIGAKP